MGESGCQEQDVGRNRFVGLGSSGFHVGDGGVDDVANILARKHKHLIRQASLPVKLALVVQLGLLKFEVRGA